MADTKAGMIECPAAGKQIGAVTCALTRRHPTPPERCGKCPGGDAADRERGVAPGQCRGGAPGSPRRIRRLLLVQCGGSMRGYT